MIVVTSTIGLLSIYTMFLFSRAILDSDVVQYYLPIAKEIIRGNGFTYSTGYDYNILLKPMGVSVLYAWTYVINGSTLSEAFRLMPLVPVLMLILLNYAIASSSTKSKTIGILSTAIFLFLPFHDRLLLYNAFYPDTFYYPLVFAVIYFLLEYSKSKHSNLLFWSGIGLGVAGLLKAQTVYVSIAFMLVLLALELGVHKKLLLALFCLAPFYILTPNILANSIQREGFRLLIPSFTQVQWILFVFLSILSSICYYVTIYNNSSEVKACVFNSSMVKSLVKKISLFLIPFAVLSGLWYMNNLLRFGSLIWTSSINLPNYNWSLGVLQSLETAPQKIDLWHYLVYFTFIFMDPAVMGYIMLVPFLIGLVFMLRKRTEGFRILFIFSMILSAVILSNVVISLNPTSGYNPRDIFILAPLLTITTAAGIVFITSTFDKAGDNMKSVLSFFIIAYLGLLSYTHSVLVYFTNTFCVTMFGKFIASLGQIVGLSLMQTSFQLSYADRAMFIGNNILRIISFSLIAGIPVLILTVYQCYKIFVKKRLRVIIHFQPQNAADLFKKGFVILLILSVITIPRLEMLLAQGGIREIKESQLKNTYRAFYELIVNGGREFEGGILTFKATDGLPYYLQGIKVIDLRYPANLAFFKDCLLSNSSYEAATKLKQQGIRYILVNPSITQKLDASLNFTISKIIQNPEYAILTKSLDSWKLYTLGPYEVEKTFVPLSGWSVDLKYTDASYTLNSTESGIFLELKTKNINSRVMIHHRNVPKLNLSNYDYIVVDAKGSSNAQVLIRFFLENGESFDFFHWEDISTLTITSFDLHPYAGRILRGDAFIGLKSTDGTPSSILIQQIVFIKVKGCSCSP
ncbi:MAG: glycosyltransferase family 39 protein [Nitrososphaeria archaeon]